ncbi:Pol polyprotein, partial [Dictyocoela roeselum]
INNVYQASERNEVIALDIKGPINIKNFNIEDAEKDQFYILVITDLYSRFTEICFIWDVNSETVKLHFEEKWLKIYERPYKCLTDNGKQFLSIKFRTILKKYGITHIVTAPYNPTGNSIVERINKEIGLTLRISKNKNLLEIERNIWRRLNLNANSSLGFSPYEIYFKKPIFSNISTKIKINDREIQKNLIKSRERYSNNKQELPELKIGDYVFKKTNSNDKIDAKWTGPYEIVKLSKNKNNVYISEGNKISKISIKNLRIFGGGEDVMTCENQKMTKSQKISTKQN